MFNVIEGDLFNIPVDVIVHGCNCHCRMGSGVAAIVKREYPGAWLVDQNTVPGDKSKLGRYTHWSGPHARLHGRLVTIVNAYTQYDYGNHQVQLDYDALTVVMKTISVDFKDKSIAMPRIGCGLAGGDPAIVRNTLDLTFANTLNNVLVVKLPGEQF